MQGRSNHERGSRRDPDYVHTSRDGRKYIKPDEIVRLDKFKRQMDRLRAAVRNSRLVKES